MRKHIRLLAKLWLAWTVAGLFYISQDSVPRLYRGETVAWKYVFVGWMVGMYVCAALTPVVLWLGDRWPVERRLTYAGLHLCFSVVFSILTTVIEVPLLLLLGVFPSSTPPPGSKQVELVSTAFVRMSVRLKLPQRFDPSDKKFSVDNSCRIGMSDLIGR